MYASISTPCKLLLSVFADQASSGLQHRASAAARLPEARAPPQSATHRPRRQRRALLQKVALGASVKFVAEMVRFAYTCTTAIGSRILPRSIVSTLQGNGVAGITAALSVVMHNAVYCIAQHEGCRHAAQIDELRTSMLPCTFRTSKHASGSALTRAAALTVMPR